MLRLPRLPLLLLPLLLSCAHAPGAPAESAAPAAAETAASAVATPSAPEPATADGRFRTYSAPELEILIQRGHPTVETVDVQRFDGRVFAVSRGGGDARAWELGSDGRWVLQRIWPNVFFSLTFDDDVTPVTSDRGAEVVRAGAWGTPLLTSADGVPPRFENFWRFYIPRTGPRLGRFLAFRDLGDSNLDGASDEWHLFFAPTGKPFAALEVAGLPRVITDFTLVGPTDIAVRGDEDQPYAFFRYTERGWTPFELVAGGRVIALERLDFQDLLALEVADPAGARKVWLARGVDGALHPIANVLPELPARVAAVRAVGHQHAIGVQEEGDANGDGRASTWSWYLRGTGGQWAPLTKVLPGVEGPVDEVLSFAGNEGIAVRRDPIPAIQAGTCKETLRCGEWDWFLREGEGWSPVADPSSGRAPQEVQDFAEGKGFGVRTVPAGWRWFVQQDGRWTSLGDVVPGLPQKLSKVSSDDPARALTVEDEQGTRAHFVHLGKEWQPLGVALEGVPARVRSVKVNLAAGAVTVEEEKGPTWVWVRDPADAWKRTRFDEAPDRSLGAAGRMFTRVESFSLAPDGATALLVPPAPEQPLKLARRTDGTYVPATTALPQAPRAEELRGDHHLLSVRVGPLGSEGAWRHGVGDGRGGWTQLQRAVKGAPPRVRGAYAFLGGRGVALQDDGDSNKDKAFNEWHFFLRGEDGAFRPLSELVAGAPSRIEVAYSLSDHDGLVLQERGDADGDERPNEWSYFLHDPSGGWRELHALIPGAPTAVWRVELHGAGRIVAVQEHLDADGDGTSWAWRYFERSNGGVRPLAAALPGSPEKLEELSSLWGGEAVALRAPGGKVTLYELHSGSWRAVPVPWTSAAELRSDRALRMLAARGDDGWRLYQLRDGALRAVSSVHPAVPELVSDVRLAGARFAVFQDGKWRWFASTDEGATFSALGRTVTPDWPGRSFTRVAEGLIELPGATHTLDGKPWLGVPSPQVWLRPERAGEAAGTNVLSVTGVVPKDVELYGAGERGAVVVYTLDGVTHAAAFSYGTVEVSSQTLSLPGGKTQAVPFILNALPDGTTRMHRMSDPTRFITLLGSPKTGAVYFDDRGFFYATTARFSEVMTFRNRNEVYSFDQLAAYLFRPDKLEERLGVPSGTLFELTENDRRSIDRAIALAGGADIDVAKLKPPKLRLSAPDGQDLPLEVDEPQLLLDAHVSGEGVTASNVTVRILGAGQTRSAPPPPKAWKPASVDDVRSVTARKPVPLLPGQNVVEVVATDANQLTHTRRLTVTYTPKQAAQSELYVAVVAAGEYDDSAYPPLPLTQSDAFAVKEAFARQQGKAYRAVHVKTFCQRPGCDAAPTGDSIRQGVPEFFDQMKDGDYAVLYVSGHGVKWDNRYYFVPADARADLAASLIEWTELRDFLTRSARLGRKLVLLDTCHSGAVGGEARDQDRLVQQSAEQDGVYILSASAAEASAYELSDLGNGLFTYVLKTALSGAADTSPVDAHVSFEELGWYLSERVRAISSARRIRQEPHVPILDAYMNYVLAHVPRVRAQLKLDVVERKPGKSERINPQDRVHVWQDAITASLEGVRLSDLAGMTHQLTLFEGAGEQLSITLETREGKKLLDRRKVKGHADALALIAKAIAAEGRK